MLAALGLWIVGVILIGKLGGDEPGPVATKVVYAWSMLCLLAAAATFADIWLPVWPLGFALRKEGDETQVFDGDGALVARAGDIVRLGGWGYWSDETGQEEKESPKASWHRF